jgi:hypothetical protein
MTVRGRLIQGGEDVMSRGVPRGEPRGWLVQEEVEESDGLRSGNGDGREGSGSDLEVGSRVGCGLQGQVQVGSKAAGGVEMVNEDKEVE